MYLKQTNNAAGQVLRLIQTAQIFRAVGADAYTRIGKCCPFLDARLPPVVDQ
jgi:hypothetical protein